MHPVERPHEEPDDKRAEQRCVDCEPDHGSEEDRDICGRRELRREERAEVHREGDEHRQEQHRPDPGQRLTAATSAAPTAMATTKTAMQKRRSQREVGSCTASASRSAVGVERGLGRRSHPRSSSGDDHGIGETRERPHDRADHDQQRTEDRDRPPGAVVRKRHVDRNDEGCEHAERRRRCARAAQARSAIAVRHPARPRAASRPARPRRARTRSVPAPTRPGRRARERERGHTRRHDHATRHGSGDVLRRDRGSGCPTPARRPTPCPRARRRHPPRTRTLPACRAHATPMRAALPPG